MADKGSDSPHLSRGEQQQVAAYEPLRPIGIHEILRSEGEAELARGVPAMLWNALAAGLSMGLSFAAMALISSGLPDQPWRHLVASAGYTIGFVVIILGRQQLFTESTLTAVLPVLTRRDLASLTAMLRLWGVVLVANIAGTWAFAAMLAYGQPFRPEVAASMAHLAGEAIPASIAATLLKGVLAGWLIALMVWLLPSARSAQLFVIMLLTYLVALARLPHIIAGSSEAAYAVLTGARSLGAYAGLFFLPTLVGNTLGGVILTAMLNHAPVSPELTGDDDADTGAAGDAGADDGPPR